MSNDPPHQPGPYQGVPPPGGPPGPPGPPAGGPYPPGPYPPGHAAHPGYGPTPPRRRGTAPVWAIALAVGLGVVLVAGVMAVAAGGGDGSPGSSPRAAASQLLDAVGDGDRDAAQAALCGDAVVAPDLDELLAGDPQLSLQGEITEDELVPQVDVAGTWRGEPAEGGLMAGQRRAEGDLMPPDPDAPWCVSVLTVGPPLP